MNLKPIFSHNRKLLEEHGFDVDAMVKQTPSFNTPKVFFEFFLKHLVFIYYFLLNFCEIVNWEFRLTVLCMASLRKISYDFPP
jgi:hypothetical protein